MHSTGPTTERADQIASLLEDDYEIHYLSKTNQVDCIVGEGDATQEHVDDIRGTLDDANVGYRQVCLESGLFAEMGSGRRVEILL